MTNEEKASEVVIKIQNSSSLDYDGRRAKYMYDSAMEMAKWKDKEITDLQQKLNAEKKLRKQIVESVRGLPQQINELIKAMNMVI